MITEFINLPWPRIILLFGFFYLLLLIFAWFHADRILFPFPEPASYSKESVDFFVSTQNDIQIACIKEASKRPNGLVVLYSHGNAEDLGMVRERLKELTQFGCDFISYDYPGYGLSGTTPSEDGCNQAIESLYEHLIEKMNVKPENIVLWGRSLGTGPSCILASKYKVAGLLLETPFLSAFRTITEIPILPWDRFRNINLASSVQCPSLVIHGSLDEVIPFRQGRRIHKELPEPKYFVEIKDAFHNNLAEKGGRLYKESINKFLKNLVKD